MSIPVRQMLVAEEKYDIKCPYPMTAEYITIHNTENDASANNEIQYMITNNNEVSFHFAIDDQEVVQGILLNRNAWHAGDGSNGTGNRKSIGIEICYSKSGGERYYKAEDLAIRFVAQLLRERGWGIDRVKKHQDWSGKNCPHRILEEGRWNQVLNKINAEMKGGDELLEKAIVIHSFADFPIAEPLAAKLKAPIYIRAALPSGKAAKELFVVGGDASGLQADKVTVLAGPDRYATAAKVKEYLG